MEEASATDPSRQPPTPPPRDDATPSGGGGGESGRLHGDRDDPRRRSERMKRGGARPGPADAVAARSASEDTTTSEIREKEFQSFEAGKLVPTVSAVSYWVSAGAWRRSRASQPTARSAMASALGSVHARPGGGERQNVRAWQGGYYCKECPGKGICEDGGSETSARSAGVGICEHGGSDVRVQAECGGSGTASTEGAMRVQGEGARASASTGGGEDTARSAGLEYL